MRYFFSTMTVPFTGSSLPVMRRAWRGVHPIHSYTHLPPLKVRFYYISAIGVINMNWFLRLFVFSYILNRRSIEFQPFVIVGEINPDLCFTVPEMLHAEETQSLCPANRKVCKDEIAAFQNSFVRYQFELLVVSDEQSTVLSLSLLPPTEETA